jgi:DNA polymerase III psi subunit
MNSTTPIKLPPSLLAELYKNDLIFGSNANSDVDKKQKTKQADTLVLTSELNSSQSAFLESILKACKLNTSAVPLILISPDKKIEHAELEDLHQPKIVLMFGIEPHTINLPIHFPPFQIQQFNRIQFLCSPSLSQLESDKELKKKLWQSLQHLYA